MPDRDDKPFVLIVDDTEANLRVLGPMLRAQGWAVAAATRGDEALALIARRRPDLVLLDIMMPDMDGYEVCRRLRAEPATRDLPVLFITALAEEADIVRGFTEGAQDYITKPFRPAELIARVRTHLELQAALRRSARQADDLARLNADKDRFFSIIAHDLRSPLAGLAGLSEALAAHPEEFSPKEIADSAREMADSARNVYQLLENLLQWARLQTGRMECRPETFDLAELFEELGELYGPVAHAKGVALRIETQITPICADRAMAHTVFRNLVSNAMKYTAAGGTVTLRARPANAEGCGEVTDTGLGMKPEELEKLLAPCGGKPTSRPGTAGEPGTGLGLVLCGELLRRNHGHLSATSALGAGSTFTVTLPREAPAAGAAA